MVTDTWVRKKMCIIICGHYKSFHLFKYLSNLFFKYGGERR